MCHTLKCMYTLSLWYASHRSLFTGSDDTERKENGRRLRYLMFNCGLNVWLFTRVSLPSPRSALSLLMQLVFCVATQWSTVSWVLWKKSLHSLWLRKSNWSDSGLDLQAGDEVGNFLKHPPGSPETPGCWCSGSATAQGWEQFLLRVNVKDFSVHWPSRRTLSACYTRDPPTTASMWAFLETLER